MIDRSKLHSLADNELPEAEKAELLRALKSLPEFDAEYQSILGVKAALKSKLEYPDTNSLWTECRSRLDEIDKVKRVESFVGRYAWGICGVFMVAILVGGVFNRSIGKRVLPDDVAGYVAGLSPISIPRGQSQAELEPALKQVVGAALAGRPAKMAISGIGQSNIPGTRTSYVQLSDEFGTVAVVALHDIEKVDGLWDYEPDSECKCSKVDGVNAMFWKRSDNVICMVVGNRSYDELHTIIRAMCPKN